MKRTIGDGDVYCLIMGEDHSIVAHYVLRAESWEEMLPGLWKLRGRLNRLGTLSALVEWWGDRCCDGALPHRLGNHIVCSVFGLARAPMKDLWHGINGVTKTCIPGCDDQKSEFARDLSNALIFRNEQDIEQVWRVRGSPPPSPPSLPPVACVHVHLPLTCARAWCAGHELPDGERVSRPYFSAAGGADTYVLAGTHPL